jgi:hypothetical protein
MEGAIQPANTSTWQKERAMLQDTGSLSLGSYVKGIFEAFKTARQPYELIWEELWYNFLGQYQAETVWRRKTEGAGYRSRIFIKLTAVKCHAAHAKISDTIFPGNDGVPFDVVSIGGELCAALNIPDELIQDAVHAWKHKLRDHFKKIELQETMNPSILEMAIFGTGVLKGPIIERRRYAVPQLRTVNGIPVNQFDPSLDPFEFVNVEEIVPTIDAVPLWEYYVDPNAKRPSDSIGEIHFQRLLPAHFRRFAYQGGYKADRVLEAARHTAEYHQDDKTYVMLGDNYMGTQGEKDERVSTLEYWGLVPVPMLAEEGVKLPSGLTDDDTIEALVVLAADSVVIKATVNPLNRRPFFVCPYKERPNCIYGAGVAEAMRDSQKMINSAARLIIDNKALSGSGMVGINHDRINWKKTGDNKVYPGKTWYVKGAFKPKDAVDAIAFPDITAGLQELMEMFERFADEETGLPKYTQGEQDSFLNKTATGMSMLMGQANLSIKTVIKNIDDRWIEPIVESMQEWIRDTDDSNPLLRIPVKVKASGTDSLMAKELKLEALFKTMQVTSAPQDAIFLDRVKLMKQIFRLLETEDVMRSDEQIQQIMDEMSKQASTPTSLREIIDLSKIYQFLTKMERAQVLMEVGIEPDPNAPAILPPALPQQKDGPVSSSPSSSKASGGPSKNKDTKKKGGASGKR